MVRLGITGLLAATLLLPACASGPSKEEIAAQQFKQAKSEYRAAVEQYNKLSRNYEKTLEGALIECLGKEGDAKQQCYRAIQDWRELALEEIEAQRGQVEAADGKTSAAERDLDIAQHEADQRRALGRALMSAGRTMAAPPQHPTIVCNTSGQTTTCQ